MKVKVPGAESSTGVKAIDFSLPAGEYTLELAAADPRESAKSPCTVHAFPSVVIDGPDDEKTGRTTQGRKFTHRVIQLHPDHESFREGDTRAADEIADLALAADVEIAAGGVYESEDFAGKRVKVSLGVRQGKDQDGNPRPENTVRQVRDDEGHIHLFLSDDGRPIAHSAASKGTKKASAGSKRR